MSKKKTNRNIAAGATQIESRRKKTENVATFGLTLIALALVGPFATSLWGAHPMYDPDSFSWSTAYKWVYAVGALIFTAARLVNVSDPGESMRVRRLRRMEFWAGMAFCIGAFFWFYNTQKLSGMAYIGQMSVLRDTVMFSLVGAMLQVISFAMVTWRIKKERGQQKEDNGKKD